MKSLLRALAILVATTVPANHSAVLRPWRLLRTPKVVTLVAGPVSKKANPAPGETPPARRTATSGVAPEAQT